MRVYSKVTATQELGGKVLLKKNVLDLFYLLFYIKNNYLFNLKCSFQSIRGGI